MKSKDSKTSPFWTPTSQNAADGTIQIALTEVPSLNKFYASKHWTIRKKFKDHFSMVILAQLSQYPKTKWDQIEVISRANVRLDLDNQIMATKFGLDTFKAWGGIPDDTTKHVKRIEMLPDETLPKGLILLEFRKK
jgi:hypothetical protein